MVIIGAPRSGTNMLRDIITELPDLVTWPCDEINPIWRHGNRDLPSDEIPEEAATSAIRAYIDNQFHKISNSYHGRTVVEKTCANCLRVPFVAKILPNARFLHIYRDGVDAAVSASRRWRAGIDWTYTLRKARFLPKSDIPYYARRYLRNHVHRLFSSQRRVSTWGPRFKGMDEMLLEKSLLDVCMHQWTRCVQLANAGLQQIPSEQVIHVKYESFVENPVNELAKILHFLNIEECSDISSLVDNVSTRSVGLGRSGLTRAEVTHLTNIGGETLPLYGY